MLGAVVLSQTTPTTMKHAETTKWVKVTGHPTKHSSELFWSSTKKQLVKEHNTEATTKTMKTELTTPKHVTITPKHVTVSEKVRHMTTTMNQPGGGGGSSKDECSNQTLEWQKDIDENIEKLKELVEILIVEILSNNSGNQPIEVPCIVKSTAVSYTDNESEPRIGEIHINNISCVRCSSKAFPDQNLTPGLAICLFDPTTCLPIDSHTFNTGDSKAGAQGDFFAKYMDKISGHQAVAGTSCGDFVTYLGQEATIILNALSLPLNGLKPNDKVTFVTKPTIPSKALMESDPATSAQPVLNSVYSIAGDDNKNFWFLKQKNTIGG
jgi:hypothetical protein